MLRRKRTYDQNNQTTIDLFSFEKPVFIVVFLVAPIWLHRMRQDGNEFSAHAVLLQFYVINCLVLGDNNIFFSAVCAFQRKTEE